MQTIFLVAGLFWCFAAKAGEKYPVKSIPEALLKNANVVKRAEQVEFEIVNTGETVLRQRYALTILNENGDRSAALVEYYDKLHEIKSIEGFLYDASGNLLKKIKGKDIIDVSAVDDNNLIDDSRKKFHHFYYRVYPYTVEYEVVHKFNNSFFFPGWVPQDELNLAIEQSSYTIICPSAYNIRYRAFNYKNEPAVVMEKGNRKMTWSVTNVPAIKRVFASPSWKELTTMVVFAPSEFEIQGYRGNMSTWSDFGRFQNSLNAGRDVLPAQLQQYIKDLTSGITDEREKIRVLYSYLQKNTRYVSIQLGLGGWQPFEAASVAKKGYGDCKALTNYMYSLLKAAGIRSYYTLVYAGDNKDRMIDDFPSSQFNHVVLCVPLKSDSMWLECTSQTLPAGYMSDFTGNRKALMITEDGASVVRTPRYALQENIQFRTVKAAVDEEGNLNMDINTKYGGTQQDNVSSLINNLSKEKVQKVLQRGLELSTYEINSFKYDETKTASPEVNELLSISARNYATVTGRRLFIIPNILNRSNSRLIEDEPRIVDYVFDDEWRDADDIEITIPKGYFPESIPQEVRMKTKFGLYECSVRVENNKIMYHRVREQYAGRFSPSEGPELSKFLGEIYKADRNKMVLKKAD